MTAWRRRVAPDVVRAVAAVMGLFALAELLTVVVAVTWLDASRLPVWLVAMWSGRTVLYALAGVWLWRQERRGLWMALLALATVWGLWASPLDVWEQEQHGRRQLSLLLALLLAWAGGPGTAATQPTTTTSAAPPATRS